ncbi:Ser/Thr phosphatase family protein [Toxoplasma gondii VAND]|uniref:Ser/Thr phosphatase family protein n=1 Tax=Toxoplasma gondii VAND TaxID=933077 RepID=A0A086PGU9_TOXGO|nr:Ser/Thr phosphatase family protein [Toxoplasma gondii VAND]
MKIAIEGCCHGELDAIYSSLARLEEMHKMKVDLLICCGDFQCVRDSNDLQFLACPPKYRDLRDFPAYFRGEKEAPCLTVFVGGNHEAPTVLRELYYGGWVAPKIFYLGHAGVVNVGGVRIAGLSGIFKSQDYRKGYFERPPYTEDTMRSAYHVREFEIAKLSELTGRVDIVVTHDWPEGIYDFGDKTELIRQKPFLEKDIQAHELGNPHSMELLKKLKPAFWFAAHLHTRFAAVYVHPGPEGKATRFLALDKVLPRREFLQILEVEPLLPAGYVQQLSPGISRRSPTLCYDEEWLAILRANQQVLPVSRFPQKSCLVTKATADDLATVKKNLASLGLRNYRETSSPKRLSLNSVGAAAAAEDARRESDGDRRSAREEKEGCEEAAAGASAGASVQRTDIAAETPPQPQGGQEESTVFEWINWADPRAPYTELKEQRLFLLRNILGFDEADDKFGEARQREAAGVDVPVDWTSGHVDPQRTTEEVDICLDLSDEETA